MHIRRGDLVEVKKGTDAWDPDERVGRGRVLKVLGESDRVIVEGIRMVVKHQRKSRQHPEGARIRKEAAINTSNVLVVCAKCDRGVRTGTKTAEDGKRVRYCKACGEEIPTHQA